MKKTFRLVLFAAAALAGAAFAQHNPGAPPGGIEAVTSVAKKDPGAGPAASAQATIGNYSLAAADAGAFAKLGLHQRVTQAIASKAPDARLSPLEVAYLRCRYPGALATALAERPDRGRT